MTWLDEFDPVILRGCRVAELYARGRATWAEAEEAYNCSWEVYLLAGGFLSSLCYSAVVGAMAGCIDPPSELHRHVTRASSWPEGNTSASEFERRKPLEHLVCLLDGHTEEGVLWEVCGPADIWKTVPPSIAQPL